MNKYLLCFLSIFLLATCEFNASETVKNEKDEKKKESIKEETVETEHTVTINGQPLSYKATAGTLVVKNDKGEQQASFFYVAYTKNGVEDKSERPIAFCFNGGPGSSAIWLHMGMLGPRKVALTDEGYGEPPYRLIDNEFSLLDQTDLVFIDPISTGYSRAAPGHDPKQFHGVEEDIKSIAEFIRLYTTRYNRWDSPKFLIGESYGTTRAAGLADTLYDDEHLYLNGIILISSILNFQTVDSYSQENDLPHVLYLPSYTATAWYHKKLPSDLQKKDLDTLLKEAEDFAQKDYAYALLKGDALDKSTRKNITEQLSRYTGLPVDYLEANNLRVSMLRFAKQLLKDQKRTVGRFDSRFIGISNDICTSCIEFDPSADAVYGPFTAAFNQYAHKELHWEKDDKYEIIANVLPWTWGTKGTNQYLNVSSNLRDVMTRNPELRVFVANGIFDLATPYFATEYTFSHLGLDPSLRDHVQMEFYDAGHMMYIQKSSLIKIKKDLAGFIQKTLKKQ
jgi:carboxypeptidase C (cathepsin A)